MQYAERLPTSRSLLGPVLALAVGAAAATGAFALLDDDTILRPAPEVVVIDNAASSPQGDIEHRGSKASQTGTTVPVTGEPGSPGTAYGTAQYRLGR